MTTKNSRSPITSLSDKYFELLLVAIVLIGTLVIHRLLRTEQLMLHFYYIPVLVAAHYFGRKAAGTTALFAFLAVVIFAMSSPARYVDEIGSPLLAGLVLCTWGGFLGLNAVLFGTLCDQRAAHIRELHDAHLGIIEILSKYLQATDTYTKSHSMRVADLAEGIAREMRLSAQEAENIRVGALLHDIGKVEVSTRLIRKAADLTEAEREEMASHTFHGAELVGSLGSILQGAIPVIMHHHDHYAQGSDQGRTVGEAIPLGARVVAVADAYDAIVTDRPYRRGRTPKEAIAVIQECAGRQFDPEVVAAFERVMRNRINEEDALLTRGMVRFEEGDRFSGDPRYNLEIPDPNSESYADSGS